jgi:hypothetical protein
MSPVARLLSAITLCWIAVPASAQTFDLRNVGKQEPAAPNNALDRYLYSTSFKSPVGNYVATDEWEEMLPVINDDGTLKVASSLVQAARDESDARALSSVLAAYRVGADKEPVAFPSSGPTITLGAPNGGAPRDDEPTRPKRRPLPDSALPPPIDYQEAEDNIDKPKSAGLASNPRLGARIVANLATFRSCSGALIKYLDHLGANDAKAFAWTRMIRRSMGVAASPPDDSCLSN